ncbi:MAG: DUF2231 domain-containing protein [Gemmatimonadaceae bacterium]
MRSTARVGTHPIHPMLVPFPIALWSGALIFDLVAKFTHHYTLHTAAFYMSIAGCVAALAAAVPGLVDLLKSVPAGTAASRTGWRHGLINVAALLLMVVSAMSRTRGAGELTGGMTRLAYLTEIFAVVLITYSGWLGGSLIYDHKVGIEGEGVH